jgi:heme exporter protein A
MNSASDGLKVENIHVWRGDSHVLKGISFAMAAGELLHVVGPNGAGKSTLLRVMCGLLWPEQGEVSWRGQPIRASSPQFQAEMAYASHEPALKGDLTALENLQFAVGLKRRVAIDELLEALARCGVEHCARLPARVLSAGQRRRVSMARILALEATLWLLDEPFTNLDAQGSTLLSGLLKEHVAAAGLAVVVAHQDMNVDWPLERLDLQA